MTGYRPLAGASRRAGVPPLVVHVVFRFGTGGLENGVVNLINHMPTEAYRHVVVALDEVVPSFARRIRRDDVEFVALHKPPGQTWWLYPRLLRLFRDLRPAVVHTRNLAALETQAAAWLAGVPLRIHGEHGRDVGDLDGTNRRLQWVRRAHRPFVNHYVALSHDLEQYLTGPIGVSGKHVTRICNGVDTERFHPAESGRRPIPGSPFNDDPSLWLVGTVGRMQPVKNQTALAEAFVCAVRRQPTLRERLRLVLVGDGPLRAQALAILASAGIAELAWLPGDREDVADVMRGLDCFVLPSLAEGISNTILEAMATALPVLATDVGGNAQLVEADRTGLIVAVDDVDALTSGLLTLAMATDRAALMGRAGRARVEQQFSLLSMVNAYQGLYDTLSAGKSHGTIGS